MVQCPHCRRALSLKGATSGRYKPRCPNCRRKFQLEIPEDPHLLPVAKPLPPQPHGKMEDTVSPAIALGLGIEADKAADAASPTPAADAASAAPAANAAPSVAAAVPAAHRARPADKAHPAASAPAAARVRATATASAAAGRPTPPSLADAAPASTATAVAEPAAPTHQAGATIYIELRPPERNTATEQPGEPPELPKPPRQPESSEPREPGLSIPGADSVGSAVVPGVAKMLGGYLISRKLGQGGMGTVYLARQLSLDRNVAVKVLHSRYADDAQFVARFVREAYAAAQLVHHNVVQIHDIGAEEATHYYSMEFVPGYSLADLVQQQGRLDPQTAAGYVLQAARGLRYAHDHGMVHRDIKPENLLLNDQGIVKIADLGLVKTLAAHEAPAQNGAAGTTTAASGGPAGPSSAGSNATSQEVILGTPAYMAPEQAEDSTKVDARADIYALGCTLYVLLTGRTPFDGNTTQELIRKHARQAMVPPHQLVPRVPESLSAIVLRMTAKRPQDRYQNVTQAIRALEEYLGAEAAGSGAGTFSPREEHVETLERCVREFNGAKAARMRSRLVTGFFGLGALGAVATAAVAQHPALWISGIVVFAVMTLVCYQVLTGLTQRTHLFARFREMAWTASWSDWAKWALVAGLAVAALFALDWLWPALGLLAGAAGLAVAFHLTVDRWSQRQRRLPLDEVQQMLRSMRLRGLEEDALRQFVCHYSGNHWEQFYERLFGYEAKLSARRRWGPGPQGQARRRYGAWRDPIFRWIDQRQEAIRREREKRHIQRVEARGLEARGIEAMEARRRARRLADDMVDQAAEFHAAQQEQPQGQQLSGSIVVHAAGADGNGSLVQRERPLFVLDGKWQGARRRPERYLVRRYGGPLDWVFGQPMRFLLAAVVLLGFITWRYQNRAGIIREWQKTQGQRVDPTQQDPSQVGDVHLAVRPVDYVERPLSLPAVPQTAAEALSSWNAAVAGVILLFSALFRSRKIGLLILPAAAVALVGHWYVTQPLSPTMANPQLAMVAGAAIALIACILFRSE